MAFGRRNRRPTLLGTAARTAVIAGTATAASNAVNKKAAEQQATTQQAAFEQQQATMLSVPETAPPAPVAAPAAAPAEDLLSKLERLAALHASGALTDAEFSTVKKSIIG